MAGYLLEKLVGVGGMAAVYRARDERLGRAVALKLLAGDEVVRKRFVREAHAVAAVGHPHIIPVYEAGEAEGVLFIAMRFVAGDDLRVVVGREGALLGRGAPRRSSPRWRRRSTPRTRPGWYTATSSPRTCWWTWAPGPARARVPVGLRGGQGPAVERADRGRQFLGTPDYAAPEQISGRDVDGRADQYALACVAFTLLSGSVPFRREVPMAVLTPTCPCRRRG